jgi:HAMP domain-containing protein
MERLRDKRNVPGSLEAELVEAIKIDMLRSAERRPVALGQQRKVLEAVLDRRRTHGHWDQRLLRPVVVVGLLFAAGVTLAMVGRSRIAQRSRRDFADEMARERFSIKPSGLGATTSVAEMPPATPTGIEAATLPSGKRPEATPTRSASKQAQTARRHEPAVEDPAYVGAALRVLRTDHDPARALRLLGKYLKAYPRGMLSEEALALSIEAAVDLGSASAKTFAQRYLTKYPNGRFHEAADEALRTRPR